MSEILLETIIDSVKILPFLFIAYFIIELFEHNSSRKLEKGLKHFGVIGGAVLGSFPQCGFSVAAANLYSGRLISSGTLIAVFISTSDEAVPILLTQPNNFIIILKLISVKILIAVIAGFIADLFFKNYFAERKISFRGEREEAIDHICHDCGCNEHKGILLPALKHSINIFFFMFIATFLINIALFFIGEKSLSDMLLNNSIYQPSLAALIGFIPNCASSVVLTQLFISGSISFGSAVAGLSTGAGVGLIVLLKMNNNKKQNFKILFYLYIVGTLSGTIIQLLF